MKNLTTYILAFFFIFLMAGNSVNVIAQKCKFDIDEKDAFNESSLKGFKYTANMNYSVIHYYILKDGQDYKVKLMLQRTGIIKDNILKEKSNFELKLSNGETITAKCIDNALPVIDNYAMITKYEVYYNISPADIKAIATSVPVAIRLTAIPEIDYSDKIKKRKGEKMSFESGCLLKI